MEKIGSLRLRDKKQDDTWRNRKLEVRRQEIGRYLEKLGSLRLGDKKQKDTWRKQEA